MLLRDKAYDFGEVEISRRRVLWFRLSAQSDFVLPEDERSTSQILRDSLSGVVGEAELPRLADRINSIVGGMLSKDERAQTEPQAFSVLEHRFASDLEFSRLMDSPDFRLYLRRRAAGRVKRLSYLHEY